MAAVRQTTTVAARVDKALARKLERRARRAGQNVCQLLTCLIAAAVAARK